MRDRTRSWARAGAVLLAVAAGAGACSEQSRVAPDATITIAGQVLGPDGAALSERPVRLGTGITDGEGAFAVLTLGLSCTTGACTGNVRDATTDASGRYTFSLEGRDTQSSFGEAVSVLVSATGSPTSTQVSGPLASARFQVQAAELELPTLTLIDPGLALEAGDGVVAHWSSPRVGPYELTYEDGHEVPVWLVRTAESAATIDPRLLEDTAGRAVVGGAFEDAIEGSDVEMRWRSPGVAYAGGLGAPPSRGRPCHYLDPAGGTYAAQPGCDLTDGDLATTAAPPACPPDDPASCAPAASAVVELGESVPAELVVVRGCEGGCAVEVSADSTTFRPAGAVSDDFGTVALDGQPITAVRVGVGSWSPGLREVSVWAAAPGEALRSLDEDGREELAAPYDGAASGGDELPMPLVAIAVVAAAGALVGVGIALGRRRAVRT